jgi:hypothetical protein
VAESKRRELLRSAADLMGRTELAVALKVKRRLLDAWLAGYALMPDHKFVALAAILNKAATEKKD